MEDFHLRLAFDHASVTSKLPSAVWAPGMLIDFILNSARRLSNSLRNRIQKSHSSGRLDHKGSHKAFWVSHSDHRLGKQQFYYGQSGSSYYKSHWSFPPRWSGLNDLTNLPGSLLATITEVDEPGNNDIVEVIAEASEDDDVDPVDAERGSRVPGWEDENEEEDDVVEVDESGIGLR
ncbi:hypothetical protein PSTT_09734 [Puccinia striiformis]|uniref:Uncharacterized protein n=1 Tax=Puccinia striiformis TaxID=27350 RepID=A0A2S4V790_9BASI|nr:hypothetical protein PSTT_09734 [Puccinia striiformis]